MIHRKTLVRLSSLNKQLRADTIMSYGSIIDLCGPEIKQLWLPILIIENIFFYFGHVRRKHKNTFLFVRETRNYVYCWKAFGFMIFGFTSAELACIFRMMILNYTRNSFKWFQQIYGLQNLLNIRIPFITICCRHINRMLHRGWFRESIFWLSCCFFFGWDFQVLKLHDINISTCVGVCVCG